ncbi:hypothetical protein [Rhizorhabdus argentea]|uniref:hypothetical protein n=1 Tax=Rhizorhabdus argentea TaxID=1387174 RepID=UPI0030ECE82F
MRHQRALLALLCIGFGLFQLYAFHWGVITPDTVVQYGQALSGRYDDWHPPVTAWLWRQLLRIGPGGAPFLLLDIALYWGAIGLIADSVRARHGWRAAALPILFALLPIPFGQVGAILKDPLMACLMLMAAALLVRRAAGGPAWLAAIAVPLILIAAATRFNALFAALPLLLLALPTRWTAHPLRLCVAAAAALALLLASNWAINEAALRPSHSHPLYSLINFDLAGIVAQGGANGYPGMSDAQARAATAHCYEPRSYGLMDEAGCGVAEDSLADHVSRTGDSPMGIWLNAVIAAPAAYTRHRLAHLDWNWRFLHTLPGDAVYLMSQPNDLGLRFTPNEATSAVVWAAQWLAWSPLGRPATWLALALGLVIAAPRLPSRRIVLALAASALFYGGAYGLISVAPDLRYNLWTMLATMTGLAIALAERAALAWRRRLLVIVPVVAAMLVETMALLGISG